MRLDCLDNPRSLPSFTFSLGLVVLAGFSLAAAGCGSSSSDGSGSSSDAGTADDGSTTSVDSDGGACGYATTCDNFASAGDQLGGTYVSGSTGTVLPSGFPAAPSGATLCGSVTYPSGDSMAGYVYYLYTGTSASLTSYYQSALTSAGDALGASKSAGISSRPCDTYASITGADVGPVAQLYIYGMADGFALGPFPQK